MVDLRCDLERRVRQAILERTAGAGNVEVAVSPAVLASSSSSPPTRRREDHHAAAVERLRMSTLGDVEVRLQEQREDNEEEQEEVPGLLLHPPCHPLPLSGGGSPSDDGGRLGDTANANQVECFVEQASCQSQLEDHASRIADLSRQVAESRNMELSLSARVDSIASELLGSRQALQSCNLQLDSLSRRQRRMREYLGGLSDETTRALNGKVERGEWEQACQVHEAWSKDLTRWLQHKWDRDESLLSLIQQHAYQGPAPIQVLNVEVAAQAAPPAVAAAPRRSAAAIPQLILPKAFSQDPFPTPRDLTEVAIKPWE